MRKKARTKAYTTGAALLASVSVVAAAGCGGGGSGSGNQGAAGEAGKPPAKSNAPVELTVFYNSGSPETLFNERWGNYLKTKFPNYTFKYITKEKGTDFGSLILSGLEIDLYIDSIGAIATPNGLFDKEAQFDMTELAKKHSIDLNRFEPTSLEMIKQFGGLYGIPVHTTSLVMYYNKDIFNRFGVPFPKDGMTWDEIEALSKRLTRKDGDKQYYGLAVSPAHYFRMNQLSLSNVDVKMNKAALNTDDWKKLLQTVFFGPMQGAEYKAKIAELKKVPGPDQFSKTQEAAMLIYFVDYKDTEPTMKTFEWDTVSVPVFKEKPGVGAQTYPTYFSVTKGSKHKDETMEVIKYIVSDEFQQTTSKLGLSVPVLNDDKVKKMFAQDNAFKNKNNQAVFYYPFAKPASKTMFDASSETQLNKALLDVTNGAIDLNTALRNGNDAVDKAIEAAKKK